ncbi:MAG: M23 family metallopeptidase [Deltaproteobacteria bacterium]|jgi:murein DD-endopeptidase MepM/ murein hydrolase activator NlpD
MLDRVTMWKQNRQNLYFKRKQRVRRRLFTVLALVLLSVGVFVLTIGARKKPSPKASPTVIYPGRFTEKKDFRQTVRSVTHSIERGDSLYQVLVSHGVEVWEVGELLAGCKSLNELQRLKPGELLNLFFRGDSQQLIKVRYQETDGKVLTLALGDHGWITSRYTEPLVVTPALARGTIKGSLYQSAIDQNIDFELALELADIFAWDIDFFVDLRPGDNYEFLYEQKYEAGKLVGNGRITAVHFYNDSIRHLAYYYKVPGRTADYYDRKGKSLRKQFLKSPLRYSRISSGYSRRRLHPILKIYRPHPGIDYAAPIGTPVATVGDGRVIFRGWKNGYGRCITIRHNNRYTTTYGHLSRYAPRSKVGSVVKQGEVIGYVGASGLATGPHLDFRMKKDGSFVNPLKERFPAALPVPESCMEDFRKRVAYLEKTLDHLLADTERESAPPAASAVSQNL